MAHGPGWLTRRRPEPFGIGGTAQPPPHRSMSKDWAGLRAATDRPRTRSSVSSRPPTQVLPTSVPVPHTRTRRSGRKAGPRSAGPAGRGRFVPVRRTQRHPAQGGDQSIDLLVGVGGGQGDPQA